MSSRPPSAQAAAVVLRAGEAGPEKFCRKCAEWWPADSEFWFADPNGAGGLYYQCKACYADWDVANKAKKTSVAAQPRPVNFIFCSGAAQPLSPERSDRRFFAVQLDTNNRIRVPSQPGRRAVSTTRS